MDPEGSFDGEKVSTDSLMTLPELEGQPHKVAAHFTQVALDKAAAPGRHSLSVHTRKGHEHTIGTLERGKVDQMVVDFFAEEGMSFSHNGPSIIHLIGYLTVSSFEDFEEKEEDDDEEFEGADLAQYKLKRLVERQGGALMGNGGGQEGEEDSEQEQAAPLGKARKKAKQHDDGPVRKSMRVSAPLGGAGSAGDEDDDSIDFSDDDNDDGYDSDAGFTDGEEELEEEEMERRAGIKGHSFPSLDDQEDGEEEGEDGSQDVADEEMELSSKRTAGPKGSAAAPGGKLSAKPAQANGKGKRPADTSAPSTATKKLKGEAPVIAGMGEANQGGASERDVYRGALKQHLMAKGPQALSTLGSAVKKPASVKKLKSFLEENKGVFQLDGKGVVSLVTS